METPSIPITCKTKNKNKVIKKAAIWFFDIEETKRPIETYIIKRKIVPMYPEKVIPISMSPSFPTVKGTLRLKTIVTSRKQKLDKNFPKTASKSFIGRVKRISIVPDFFSSAHDLIVKAGTTNIIIHGKKENQGLMLA